MFRDSLISRTLEERRELKAQRGKFATSRSHLPNWVNTRSILQYIKLDSDSFEHVYEANHFNQWIELYFWEAFIILE